MPAEQGTRRRIAVAALFTLGCIAFLRADVQLQPSAVAAYDSYADRARRAFVERSHALELSLETSETFATLRRSGAITVRPAAEDGIIDAPGGLIHHWLGAAFYPRVSLDRVLDRSRAYGDYHAMYKSIIGSRLLSSEGDTFHILLRLEDGAAGVSAVLDIRSTVRYYTAGPHQVYSLSMTDDIREVKNAGTPNEHLLPAGQDSGYLWRAAALSRFVERDGGVYVEMETLGLSRRFPTGLGWLIEPIARRLGRKSVETSLTELRAAVVAGAR